MALKQEHEELLKQFPEYVTKEQLYKICHISKRTARYLLQSGIIPYIDSGKRTRNYKIAMTDIVTYLQNREIMPEKHRMPTTRKAKVDIILDSPEVIKELQEYYEMLFANYPDVVSTAQASEMAGYSTHSLMRWLNAGDIKGFKRWSTYLIPKVCLIQFMVGIRYRTIRNMSEKQINDMGGFLKWQKEKSL